MKEWFFKIMAIFTIALAFASCKDEVKEETEVPAPSVELTPGETTESSVSFTVVPTNAVKCAWLCEEKGENTTLLSAQEIFSKGETLEEVKTQVVTVSDLMSDTEYVISAAVENEVGEQVTVKELLSIRTQAVDGGTNMKVTISDISTTPNSITFTVTSQNAGVSYYTWAENVDGSAPEYDANDIAAKGKKLDSNNEIVTIDGLKDNTPYMIYAACEAGDSYDRIMTKVEVTTNPLDGPSETIEQEFSTVTFKSVTNGKNYVLVFENNEYTVTLDMYSNDENKYNPFIPAHEYVYDKNAYMKDWLIASFSKITPNGGSDIKIEKGSVVVAYENGKYTITGSLITVENKEFKMTFTGEIPYIVRTSSPITGTSEKTDNGYDVVVPIVNGSQELKFNITGQTIDGNFTEGTNIESSLVLPNKKDYTMTTGNVEIKSVDAEKNYYNITGDIVTEEGYKVQLELTENIEIKEPEPPVETIEMVMTEASAYGYNDGMMWVTEYNFTLKNSDWELYIEFSASGSPNELPEINTPIGPGGADVTLTNRKTGDKHPSADFNYGDRMIIKKTQDGYNVEINGVVDKLAPIKATYNGPIECESWM